MAGWKTHWNSLVDHVIILFQCEFYRDHILDNDWFSPLFCRVIKFYKPCNSQCFFIQIITLPPQYTMVERESDGINIKLDIHDPFN